MGITICSGNMFRYVVFGILALSLSHAFPASPNQGSLDCQTDGEHFVSMNLTNPTLIKVKVKTCDAESCQGNPLKPDAYRACGGKDDRVMGHTSKHIHFNENTTYIVFSNGVKSKEFYKPKQGGWPADHLINIPGMSVEDYNMIRGAQENCECWWDTCRHHT